MNVAGSALAWCAVQVAVVGLAAMIAYWLVSKLHYAACGFTATTSLAVVFCLSAAAASPWPRWSFLDERNVEEDDVAGRTPGNSLLRAVSQIFSKPAAPAGGAAAGHVGAAIVANQAGTVLKVSKPEDEPSEVEAALGEMPGAFWLQRRAGPAPWRWTASLAVMFVAGFLWGGLRMLFALQSVRAIRRGSRSIEDIALTELVASLREQLGGRRIIQLRETDEISAPATIGWRRPVILLPVAWRSWSPEERRAVLAHEIAHVERGDYLMWLAAQMALVLHFYHPAVRWLVARIRLEQECAADAVAATATGPRAYLAALARLALREGPAEKLAVAPSFLATRGMLLERIERLRHHGADPGAATRYASKLAAALILITASLVASGFRSDRLEAPPHEQAAPSPAPAVSAISASSLSRHEDTSVPARPGGHAPG
ncbi:MAG: M56 family metallopeptidase [Planctomycetes bacterium]|nr:M56 family metallopeptidase [Planctomycetota bacterium]